MKTQMSTNMCILKKQFWLHARGSLLAPTPLRKSCDASTFSSAATEIVCRDDVRFRNQNSQYSRKRGQDTSTASG